MNVRVEPELLQWARERASLDIPTLAQLMGMKGRSDTVEGWEHTGELTYKQLQKLADKTHVPLGYLFLSTPPEEHVPIQDFRTHVGVTMNRPSPNLLDTIYDCQQRQDWMREYLIANGQEPLPFVGSITIDEEVIGAASKIRSLLRIETRERAESPNWESALKLMVDKCEEANILVVKNGVVGNNTHRTLNPKEFRGFALADEYAPLIFLNNKDFQAAQMFTLIHEIVHVWLGQSAVSDVDRLRTPELPVERFCNNVAAEILVPEAELSAMWSADVDASKQIQDLTRTFKVSTLVLLYRTRILNLITESQFQLLYQTEINRFEAHAKATSSGGGDFFNTSKSRLGTPFIRALITSTLQGQTLYGDAYRLLGVKKADTFQKFVERFLT